MGAGHCKAAPYASEGPHPSPAASPAIVEEPRARTESRYGAKDEERKMKSASSVCDGRARTWRTRFRRRFCREYKTAPGVTPLPLQAQTFRGCCFALWLPPERKLAMRKNLGVGWLPPL
eukprot:scaffold5244_cov61-Phaeocystis_antarctica.AAC.6